MKPAADTAAAPSNIVVRMMTFSFHGGISELFVRTTGQAEPTRHQLSVSVYT